ncbi:transglycosylase domain-containing protein [Streptomonospora sediminis]
MMNEHDDDSQEKGTDEGRGKPAEPAAENPERRDEAAAAPSAAAAGGTPPSEPAAEVPEAEGAEGADEPGEAGEAGAASGTSAFKDSGTFFRDRVARTLAEQGFNLREDGTWGSTESADTAAGAPETGREQGGAEPDSAGAQQPAAADTVSADKSTTTAAAAVDEPGTAAEAGTPAESAAESAAGSPTAADRAEPAAARSTGEPATDTAAATDAAATAAAASGTEPTDTGTPKPDSASSGAPATPPSPAGTTAADNTADGDDKASQPRPAGTAERAAGGLGGFGGGLGGGAQSAPADGGQAQAEESRSWFTPRAGTRDTAAGAPAADDGAGEPQSGTSPADSGAAGPAGPTAGSAWSSRQEPPSAAEPRDPSSTRLDHPDTPDHPDQTAAGTRSEAAGTADRHPQRSGDGAAAGRDDSAASAGPRPFGTSGAPTGTGQSGSTGSTGSAGSTSNTGNTSGAVSDRGAGSGYGPGAAGLAAGGAAAAGAGAASGSAAAAVGPTGSGPSSPYSTPGSAGSGPSAPAASSGTAGPTGPAGAAPTSQGSAAGAPRGYGGDRAAGAPSPAADAGATATFGAVGASSPGASSSGGPAEGAGSAAAGGSAAEPGAHTAHSASGGPSGPSGPDRPPGPGGPTSPGGGGKGGKKPKTKKPLWWRITRATLLTFGILAVLGLGGFGIAYATIPVPDVAKEDAVNQGSTFYYADGKTQFAERGVDREPVDYKEIPEQVQEAVISAEDRGYWTSPGVSITGTARAVWVTVTGEQVQGGSTITQQFVRNYFEGISRDQTIVRKLKEIVIALKVDQSADMDKQWVMEQYLNTIYFGRNAYGIQSAAQAYYHKDVGDLTASESAFLAAAIQQPTLYGQADSNTTPQMEKRWEYVVNGMVEEGSITQAEAGKMEFPKPKEERPANSTDLSGYKGYMLQQAMRELKDLGYTEDNLNRGGYKIVTTFDQQTMEMAKTAVEDTVDVGSLPDGVQAGLTAINPSNGEVVGFYGGKDYIENQYDSAFNGAAQAGSAFKPYVLATALEQGYSLNSTVNGNSPIQVAGSSIANYDHTSHGPTTLVEATRMSLNTGYVQLAQEVGVENVRKTANSVGIPKSMIKDDQVVPTIALGVSNVRPVDQASGFATFANGGEHVEAHVVREVVNKDGENERPEPKTTQPISEQTANNVTYALQQVVSSGTGTSAALPGRPAAGKTGTTDSSVAAWFAGFTPQLSAAVGVYNGNNQPFSVPGWGALSGGTLPASIWNNFMTRAMEGKEVKQFPEPSYGGEMHDLAPDPPPSQEQSDPADPGDQETRPEDPPAAEPPPADTPSAPVEPPPPPPDTPEAPPEFPGFPDDGTGQEEEPPAE